ncbi:MAG: glucose-6-phosphate isomerase family protein [Methanoregula sp.]|nr:glucose-6-phosphate isomerase family protein [Methanoregula sp.]
MNRNFSSQSGQLQKPAYTVCWKGPLPEPAVRTAEDLRGVLANPGCTCTGPVYYMYRDVARTSEDRRWLAAEHLRFDITVIPPRELCGEYNKTKGHYHPSDTAGTGYPEIYEVLAGEAHYLIQNKDCSDVVMIAASAGDVVVVPPEYGHVTINPSRSAVLQMANIVSSRFSSNYHGYEAQNGAAYFEWIKEGFVKNPTYRNPANLRLVKAQRLADVGDAIPDPLYNLIETRAPVLEFLNHPEKFELLFRGLYL